MDLLIDWLWFYFQVLLLVWVGFRELARPHGRNIYAMALVLATLALVHGQAWWMLSKFSAAGTGVIRHLGKSISLHGACLANRYIGLSVLCFVVTYLVLSRRKAPLNQHAPARDDRQLVPNLNGILLSVWSLSFGAVALNYLGGIDMLVRNPGQYFGRGATMFLVLTHVGRLQLLDKISRRQKGNLLDILLFGSIILFQLFNGRGWTLFFLFQLLLLINYCRREVSRKMIMGCLVVFIFIAIVFGTYRQFSVVQEEIGFSDIPYAYQKYTDTDNAVDWFYATAVEGFAGFAGILTYADSQGGISHDFGLSNLSFWIKLVPYPLRLDPTLPFMDLEDGILEIYPYKDSITRSGYESSYAHFGIMGVLGLGVLLGVAVCKFHQKMMDPTRNRLVIALFSAYLLLPLYGSFYFILFYCMTESCDLLAYKIIKSISIRLSTR